MVEFLILCVGLVILCAATEISVRGAVSIAEILRVSPLVIGLTLVAFGTDLPELFVAVRGALKILDGIDVSGLIVGNAIGSSICQIAMVAGVTAFFMPAGASRRPIQFLTIRLLGAVVLLWLVSLDGKVTNIEGGILCLAFLAYLVAIFVQSRDEDLEQVQDKHKRRRIWKPAIFVIVGLGGVLISAEIVLENALRIAELWHIRQSVVGAVIVAIGTSLPELAISVGAALKRQPGLSMGNIVGSNIFDCLIPIGVAALISGIKVERSVLVFDLPYLLAVSALFVWLVRGGRNLSRLGGIVLVVAFAGYVAIKLSMR